MPHLHFYQYDAHVFSDVGIAEYQAIAQALTVGGFSLGETQEVDIKHAREVRTPAIFNSKHSPPSVAEHGQSLLFGLGALAIYSLLVLFPGFRMLLKSIRNKAFSRKAKVAIVSVSGGALLAPMPVPLSMFGPALLVPLPMAAPLLVGAMPELLQFMGISVCVTVLLSFLVSLKFFKNGLPST